MKKELFAIALLVASVGGLTYIYNVYFKEPDKNEPIISESEV